MNNSITGPWKTGTVKTVDTKRKFGFITPDDGGADLHFHLGNAIRIGCDPQGFLYWTPEPAPLARGDRVGYVQTFSTDTSARTVTPLQLLEDGQAVKAAYLAERDRRADARERQQALPGARTPDQQAQHQQAVDELFQGDTLADMLNPAWDD